MFSNNQIMIEMFQTISNRPASSVKMITYVWTSATDARKQRTFALASMSTTHYPHPQKDSINDQNMINRFLIKKQVLKDLEEGNTPYEF